MSGQQPSHHEAQRSFSTKVTTINMTAMELVNELKTNLQAGPEPQANPKDHQVKAQCDDQHSRQRNGEPPDGQHLKNKVT